MGTRADFYIAKVNSELEWVGSIAWDGDDPEGVEQATTEQGYRNIITEVLSKREDFTAPEQGWPWPWNDSSITDCVYVFYDSKVWAEVRDGNFIPFPEQTKCFDDEGEPKENYQGKVLRFPFPDMKERKNLTLGKRSGLIIFKG